MIRIKVCGMSDPLNVSGIAQINPDYIGFIFYKGSPRYIGPEPDLRLFSCVPESIKKAGVFFNENDRKILEFSAQAGLEIIQLHGNESPEYCEQLRTSGLTIIKAFNINNEFNFESLNPYRENCDYFLFDTKSDKPGGSGKKFDWEKLEEYAINKPFFLSGGIGPEDADRIKSIKNKQFFAVDLNSRFEITSGVKDIGLVKTFIKSIKGEII
jgi:phosphoribosylanthranilate isomerase